MSKLLSALPHVHHANKFAFTKYLILKRTKETYVHTNKRVEDTAL